MTSIFEHLHQHQIFPLEQADGHYLVYAPLSELLFRLSPADVQRMEDYLAVEGTDDAEVQSLLDHINAEQTTRRTIWRKRDVSQIHKLTILPTYQCNFRCTYCYSTEGRQKKTVSQQQALAMIDYFIDRRRTPLRELWLAILGGGEPFLTPQLTGELITHARRRAVEQGFTLGIGLTTNGSVYDAGLARIMVDCGVGLGVSFEVLEDIQNAQRQHYDRVVPVVQRYMNEGVELTIKSIVTPDNVCRLDEMVEQLHRLFPLVRKYKLQIVESADMFAHRDSMRQFYRDFTAHFFSARQKGREWGIDVYVLASKYVDMLVEHYCGGEMCLNPEGTITVCHRFSSPREQGYAQVVYGAISEQGEVSVDAEKLSALLAHDIDLQPKCHHCFARWHCGGGCLAQSTIYEEDQLNIICDWTRDFTHRLLQQRWAEITAQQKEKQAHD